MSHPTKYILIALLACAVLCPAVLANTMDIATVEVTTVPYIASDSIYKVNEVNTVVADEELELEKVIAAVRSKLEIDPSLTQFDASSYQDYTMAVRYSLSWYSDTGDSVYVSADSEGEIISVDIYKQSDMQRYGTSGPRFPRLSKDEAATLAFGYILKLLPKQAPMVDSSNPSITFNRYGGYNLRYAHLLNDILVDDDIWVTIDPNNGDLRSLHCRWLTMEYANIDNAEEVIGLDAAKKALRDEIGLKLHYRLLYNYSRYATGNSEFTPKVVLEYTLNESASYQLDALSGALYFEPLIDRYGGVMGGKGGGDMVNEDRELSAISPTMAFSLTPEEQKRIDSLEGLISAEEALSRLLKLPNLDIDEEMQINHVDYHPSYGEPNREYISIYFTSAPSESIFHSANATLDAKSGELISFYSYPGRSFGMTRYAELSETRGEELQQIADSFLQTVKPKLWAMVKVQPLSETTSPYYQPSYWQDSITFTYIRQVNQIPFEQNCLYLSVSQETGKITSYNEEWQEQLEFPSAQGILTLDEAYKALENILIPELTYKIVPHADESGKAVPPLTYDAKLVYNAAQLTGFSLNAETVTIYQYGEEYNPAGVALGQEYTDLIGLSDAYKINEVALMLQLPQSELFLPEERLNQAEFLRWLYSMQNGYYYLGDDESFYTNLRYTGYWDEELSDPEKLLTTLDGVEYLVRFLNMSNYAAMQGIFINPLNLSDTEAAWVALAVGNKAITYATFEPDNDLTRLDAAIMLYNYLAR